MYVASYSKDSGTALKTTKTTLQAALCLPFDLARRNYATAVRAGLIERSMLASAKFGKLLNQMESITLGPLARTW